MNCEKATEWIQRYVDNDLEQLEERELLAHAQSCHECAELLQRMKLLAFELEQLPKVNPRYSLVDAILPKLAELDERNNKREESAALVIENEVAKKQNVPWAQRLSSYISWKLVGAVAAAGCAAVLFIWNDQSLQDPKLSSIGSNLSKDESTDASKRLPEKATADPTQQPKVVAPPTSLPSKLSSEANTPSQQEQASGESKLSAESEHKEGLPSINPSPTPEEKKDAKVSTLDNHKGAVKQPPTDQRDAESVPVEKKKVESTPTSTISPSPEATKQDDAEKDKSDHVSDDSTVKENLNLSDSIRGFNVPRINGKLLPEINNDIRIANHLYVAEIKDKRVSITTLTTHETLFASLRLWSDKESVTPIGWVSETTFQYEVAKGNKTHVFSIDLNLRIERQIK
ncbi:zf-HC2 domain-containing protein [Paenibacillus sp. KN14-4R]|uniref:anti-sigma factor family protein n=1 Tax=Paenibacillus sp. KN14-4R TaxID=3445773 RepID=UPI003FA09405